MSEPLRVIDLFTGAGGLTRGWHEAADLAGIDFETVAAVELDPFAAASYRANFGDGLRHQHVGSIEDWLDEDNVPQADVIFGGPPCQGFSQLGKQDINDPRNFLWLAYAKTIARAQPRYFVMENVAPFLKSPQYAALQASTLSNGLLEDYELTVKVLHAVDYGSAQNRKRTVVIGRRKDMPTISMPKPTHARTDDGELAGTHGLRPWMSVERAFAAHGAFDRIPDKPSAIALPKIGADEKLTHSFHTSELHLGRNYSDLSLKRFACIPAGGNRFDLPYELLAPCWRKHTSGSADVMGRLYADKPSVTIRTEFFKPEKGRYLHPTENRAITHWEAARLQGFPDDFQWIGSKTTIARQIGNAVPVELGRAISRQVLEALAASPA